jgi:hypothetical protein
MNNFNITFLLKYSQTFTSTLKYLHLTSRTLPQKSLGAIKHSSYKINFFIVFNETIHSLNFVIKYDEKKSFYIPRF